MDQKIAIKSLTHDELTEELSKLGLPKFRVQQVESWLWAHGASSFDQMTNLSKQLRADLAERFHLAPTQMVTREVSRDGTRKYLFGFDDGTAVESVGIPSADGTRLTVCFSTQAGCAMRCSFCATGKAGFTRNLTIGEMVDQIYLVGQDFDMRVSNIVAMGQGEPFLNYPAVLAALRIMNDSKIGLGVGARHITVSTCGILNGIEHFADEPEQFTLAISLHSAIQETRDQLMPGVKNQTLGQLKEAILSYIRKTNRRPTFEYALIQGVNDDQAHLEALYSFCCDCLSHVNLIPLNPITQEQAEEGMLEPSDQIAYFESYLNKHGIETSIRNSRGSDINGACGQLRQQYRP